MTQGYSVEANLKRLLDEAPPTRCGACGTPMEAATVDITVSVDFHWHDWRSDEKPLEFLAAYSGFADPIHYTGDITYRCPKCSTELIHRQRVTIADDGYHFQPPTEEPTP